jgi:hypothetical protein
VLVYGHRSHPLNVATLLDGFARRLADLPVSPSHDWIVGLLVEFGELEAAVADALLPEQDEERPELHAWRCGGRSLAEAFCSSARADVNGTRSALARFGEAVADLRGLDHPTNVQGRSAEGFACYGLYPEQYVDAAERLARELSPACVCCIGLRSIGSVLAHVVAATLNARGIRADVRTVRPRGDPYDRRVVLDRSLQRAIDALHPSHFAVVDEGPGLSGSSFAGTVDALHDMGTPLERIVLVPSWDPASGQLRSHRAQQIWRSHRRVVGEVDHLARAAAAAGTSSIPFDLSAGRWRQHLVGEAEDSWPAVQPQHERIKHIFGEGEHRTISRFAGLGRFGQAKLTRAHALADAGFGPPPRGLSGGFLALEWIDGPVGFARASEFEAADPFVARVADYIAFVRTAFATSDLEDVSDLHRMLHVNVREADLGDARLAAVDRLGQGAAHLGQCRVAVDGRMLPHEWIRGPSGTFKVDALDHHADDFLPGCRDVAWDIAGVIAEFELREDAAHAIVARYTRMTGDATVSRRLPFYRAAYLAYRMGYAALAAETLGADADGARFTRRQLQYRRSLAALLDRQRTSPRC